jgi:hypothetical protein
MFHTIQNTRQNQAPPSSQWQQIPLAGEALRSRERTFEVLSWENNINDVIHHKHSNELSYTCHLIFNGELQKLIKEKKYLQKLLMNLKILRTVLK